jgi:hypothetical protein
LLLGTPLQGWPLAVRCCVWNECSSNDALILCAGCEGAACDVSTASSQAGGIVVDAGGRCLQVAHTPPSKTPRGARAAALGTQENCTTFACVFITDATLCAGGPRLFMTCTPHILCAAQGQEGPPQEDAEAGLSRTNVEATPGACLAPSQSECARACGLKHCECHAVRSPLRQCVT